MFNDLRVRLLVIAGLLLLSAWTLYDRGITLGLDLRGGTYLALEIQDPQNALTAEQRADAIDRAQRVIRTRVDELGVAEPTIEKAGSERIVVQLPGASQDDQQRAREVLQRAAFLQFQIVRPAADLINVLGRIDRAVAAAGLESSGQTAEQSGTGAPGLNLFETQDTATDTVAPADADTAAAAAGDTDQADVAATAATAGSDSQPFSSRLAPGSAGAEGIFIVAGSDVDFIDRALALPEVQAALPRGSVLRWGTDPSGGAQGFRYLYLLESNPLITGERLQDAQAQRDLNIGYPIVTFEFDRQGGRIFERGTGQNVGNLMAIVLDEEVVSAPVIRSQIGARGQIELQGSSLQEAGDLALVLRAGALPAPIEIVEERTVGPSLGQDSIDRGTVAGIIGLILVVVIMVGYYRFSGVMAVLALVIYSTLVLAGLSSLGASLTLPGIAGFILSIGMAVDANVLIFERIREEIEVGRSPRMAVSEGFGNALSAIVDAQLTTLLTALVLYQFGTGPVRGFAVTLALGLVASMFTAIFVTRTLYMIYLDRRAAVEGISI